jgi:membrane protease YdiL (CAAX protease family)
LVGTAPDAALASPTVAALTTARRIADISVILLVGFATAAVSNLAIIFGPKRAYSAFELNLGIVQNLLIEITGLIVLFTILRYRHQPLSSLGLRVAKEDFLPGIGLFFGAYAVFIASYYSVITLIPSLGTDGAGYDFSQFGVSSPPLLTLLMLVNPCFEEIVVRGYLSTELLSLTPRKWIAVILPTLFQGTYHLYQGRLTAIAFTGVFLMFSIYFVKTRRLIPILIAHTVFDLTLIWRLWA